MKGLANTFQPQFPFKGLVAAMAQMGFNPRTLFANNEPGVWYDPSDLSTLYQDAAGTTPVTAVEQPVGLMLDKSKGLVPGPELVITPYSGTAVGGFSSTGDSLVRNGGDSRFSLTINSPVVIGRFYKVTFNVSGFSGDTLIVRIGDTGGTFSAVANNGQKSLIISAVGSSSILYFAGVSANIGTATITNISARELPGNHASQPTATSRPVLSARYNLLTKTEQFDDVVWGKTGVTVTPNTATAPDGTLTADQVEVTTANTSAPSIGVSGVTSAGITYKYSVWLRADVPTTVVLQIPNTAFTAYLAQQSAAVGTDWKQFSLTFTGQAGSIWHRGGAVGQIYNIWGADLRVANDGANLPPYQRVNTATDYDTAGFPHYLRFDGVDDWLITNTITPGIDKAQVFAGVRKTSDATRGTLVESYSNISGTGGFGLSAPGSVGGATYRVFSGGSTVIGQDASGFAAPITNVLTGLGDISGDSAILRINGTQAANDTSNQGTGNYLAYPLYIGRRAGTLFPFNGHLYSLIVRFGSNLPAATIEKTERYINTKTRAY